MTNTRKTTTPVAAAEADAKPAEPETAAKPEPVVVGPPMRPGQTPEKVTLAHHLRIGRADFRPGDTALVSPDYARQLRRNGYVSRV
ncbi:hypothetical protein [Streptomyces sp. E1N211]|uniref:hypothetical protein n=1 Tax=Streptomyces sp. E1N211 TaxID=1851876 RepID=UPI0012D9E457|nr:hypothetical protein [Streptomyces sp. E1N211]